MTKHAGLAMHRQVMYLKPRPPKARAKPMFDEAPSARKRGGARYGPAPKNPPHERMQAPKPMSDDRRAEIYGGPDGASGWTYRRLRQYGRMANRAEIREGVAEALASIAYSDGAR